MARSHILIDSNTYLRLAKTIKPLLGVEFGAGKYCLSIIAELDAELANRRLRSKFPWVDEEEYKVERSYIPNLSRAQTKEIARNFDFIQEHVTTGFPGPSRVDVRYLACALELDCEVVTDDQDMTSYACQFRSGLREIV